MFCRPGGAQDGATEPPRRPRGAGKARALHSTLSDREVSGRACPLAQGGQRRRGALSPAVHSARESGENTLFVKTISFPNELIAQNPTVV